MAEAYVENGAFVFPDQGRNLDEAEARVGFVEELAERRFVAVQGINPDQVEELMHAYAQFMDLQSPSDDYIWNNFHPGQDEVLIRPELDTEKHWHKYRARAPKPGKPNGLTDRSLETRVIADRGLGEREAIDKKEFFHFTPDLTAQIKLLHEQNGWGTVPNELLDFLDLAAPIHTQAGDIMVKCLDAMESHVAFDGISRMLLSDKDWINASPMRVLAYHTDDSEMLGQLHRDKGTTTLAIDESHEGLRVSTRAKVEYDKDKEGYVLLDKAQAASDDNMHLIARDRGTAAFFSADGLRRETGITHPAVEPTYHDIIRVPGKEFIPGKIARFALILFFNPPSGTFSSKQANHGNRQVAR